MGPEDHSLFRVEEEPETYAGEAGFMRALTRTTAIVYRTVVFGSLPRRIPVRHVGVLTDRVSTVLDTLTQLRAAKREVEVHHYSAKKQQPQQVATPRLSWASIVSRAKVLGQTVVAALPPLVQSMVLGTAVFSIYEEVKDATDQLHGLPPHHAHAPHASSSSCSNTAVDPVVLGKTLSASVMAGGLAGASHGVLFTAWEHAAGLLRSKPCPTLLVGSTLAHGTSHASLFGAYEAVKHALFLLSDSDHTSVQGVGCVAVAGAVAGLCEEGVSFYTVRWEEEGVHSLLSAYRRLGPPPPRVLLSSMLPGALGFLAFEYGREFVLQKDMADHHHDHHGGRG